MGALMRRHPWHETTFGHPDSWPAALQTSVSLCLNTIMPSCIYWGSELRMLYNDAWRLIPGSRHPRSLGQPAREVWEASQWNQVGKTVREVFEGGGSLRLENHFVPIERAGFREECYFTHTAFAIRADNGKIAGVFKGSVDTTASILDNRRSRVLQDLCAALSPTGNTFDMAQSAINSLSSASADLPFVVLLRNTRQAGRPVFTCAASAKTSWFGGLLPQYVPADAQGCPLLPLVTDERPAPPGLPPGSRTARLQPEAQNFISHDPSGLAVQRSLLMPFGTGEQWWLFCGLNPMLPLDMPYRAFFAAMAELWNSAATASHTAPLQIAPAAVLETCNMGAWSLHVPTGKLQMSARAAELLQPIETTEGAAALHTKLEAAARAAMQTDGELCVDCSSPLSGPRWIRLHAGETVNSDGSSQLMGVVSDCTEEQLRAQSLRSAEKEAALNRLAASVAHEINNPLESTINLVYLASLDDTLAPATLQLLQLADSELARVNLMAQHTLGFYRDPVQPVRTDVYALAAEMVDFFERRPENRGITLDRRKVRPATVFCYPGALRQILYCALRNSVEASVPGGSVRISLRISQHPVTGEAILRIFVSDQGAGITAENLQRIFDPFFTTRPETNNGLGLWLLRRLLQRQNGTVRVRSRVGERRGTSLMISLPTQIRRSFVQ